MRKREEEKRCTVDEMNSSVRKVVEEGRGTGEIQRGERGRTRGWMR
jgi:hypothetical protein